MAALQPRRRAQRLYEAREIGTAEACAIQRRYRADEAQAVGEKYGISFHEFARRHRPLFHGEAQMRRRMDQRLAHDAGQNALVFRRGHDPA